MFSNILGFRDITLYVIPGSVTTYIFLNILSLNGITPFPYFVQLTTANIGLLIIFAAISTCIGFIQSQIMIKTFNFFIRSSSRSPTLTRNLGIESEIYEIITKKIQRLLNLQGEFKDSPNYLSFCNSYVLARTTEHSYGYTRRLMNFSLFATVIPIPFTVAFYYFLYKIKFDTTLKYIAFALLSLLIFYFCYKLTFELRKTWAKSVLTFFLSLPEDSKESTKNNLPQNSVTQEFKFKRKKR